MSDALPNFPAHTLRSSSQLFAALRAGGEFAALLGQLRFAGQQNHLICGVVDRQHGGVSRSIECRGVDVEALVSQETLIFSDGR